MAIIASGAAGVAAGASDAKTMSADSWSQMTILEVGRESPTRRPFYLRVATGDLDGDGIADEALLKLMCVGGDLKEALYSVKSPRDAASGMPTGKRQHGSITIVKEWGASSPQLAAIRPTYDVKMLKGARTSASADGWSPITLSNTDGLCAAAAAAAKLVPKTSSNIQNN